MDKLDNILITMSTLVADMKHVREKSDAIDNKVQVLNDKSILDGATIAAAHKRLDELEPMVEKHQEYFIEASGGKKALSTMWAMGASVISAIMAVAAWLFK